MVSYHVNPTTGEPGVCRAKISCRFGAAEKHFDSKEAARKAYELEQEAFIPRKPEIDYDAIRFGKVTSKDDIVKLSASLRNQWQKQPQKRFKIKDRYGYGTGVYYVSYDDQRDEFQFQSSMYNVPRLLESSRNLNELLSKVAEQVGFADHEYEHVDVDEQY